MMEKVLAGIVLLVCAALLLRMLLPATRQQQFDSLWQRALNRLRAVGWGLRDRWRAMRRGRQARQEALAAIERARQARPPVQREGNVIRPERFGKSDSKRPPMH